MNVRQNTFQSTLHPLYNVYTLYPTCVYTFYAFNPSLWILRFDDMPCPVYLSKPPCRNQKKQREKSTFSLSPSLSAVVCKDVCHRYLFILGRKVLSPHVFSQLTNIVLTAAHCALQQPLCRLHSLPPRPPTPEATPLLSLSYHPTGRLL